MMIIYTALLHLVLATDAHHLTQSTVYRICLRTDTVVISNVHRTVLIWLSVYMQERSQTHTGVPLKATVAQNVRAAASCSHEHAGQEQTEHKCSSQTQIHLTCVLTRVIYCNSISAVCN